LTYLGRQMTVETGGWQHWMMNAVCHEQLPALLTQFHHQGTHWLHLHIVLTDTHNTTGWNFTSHSTYRDI